MSHRRTITRTLLAIAAALTVVAGVRVMSTPAVAQQTGDQPAAQTQPAEQQGEARITVGTYRPQYVFRGYPVADEATEALSQARNEMLQAHQDEDQQAMMQAQQRMQQEQQRVIQQFRQDVEQAMPEVAEQTGVDLVALEVVYQGEGVQTTDISDTLIEAMGGEKPEPQPQMQMQRPGGQGQQNQQGQQGQ